MQDQLYAFLTGTAWSAGAGHGWWRALDGSKDAWLDPAEVAAASLCVRFAPLAQHAQRLGAQLGLSPGDADALLLRLITRGLMVATATLVPPELPEVAMVDAPIIVIRTYARAEGLRHVLDTLRDDEQRYDTRRCYLVIDDSDAGESATAHAGIVAGFVQAGMNIGYFGPELRRRALDVLMDAQTPEIARLALEVVGARHGTGARAWNWATLLCAGRTLSFVDDDCEFPVRQPQHVHRIWSLQGSLANEGRFFDDVMPELPVSGEDPYLRMRRIVGQSVATIWHRDGVARNHFAGRLTSDFHIWQSQRRVLAASSGIYGGHVYNSSVFFSITDHASLKDLLRAPFRIDRLDGERIWQGVSAARMTSSAVYTPLLLDARELLPFAGSFGKADDTAFFGMLSAIEPNAAYAYLPMLVGHRPPEDRGRRARATQELLLDTNHYLGYFAQRAATQLYGQDRATRFAALAALAHDLLRAHNAEFVNDLQTWRGRNIAAVVAGLDEARRMAGAEAPTAWLEFIAQIEHANRAAMAQPMAAQRVGHCRDALSQLAHLGERWPKWWDQMAGGLADELRAASGLRAG
jgi:hypothetical protein